MTDYTPPKGTTILPPVSDAEAYTILAALRFMQNEMEAESDLWEPGFIATNGGEVEALKVSEIDALCERLNLD